MKNLQENQHFSHHHVLIPLVLDEGEEINCNGCETLIYEPFHGCLSCNYFLHDSCLNTPRFLQHSSHPHPLTLLPTPTYSSRSYTCNACGSEGESFSLSCAQCEFDLHLQCASLPKTVLIRNKHPHELKLIFGSPCKDKNTMFACDVCHKKMDQNQWLYYCAGCDFGAHLDCSKAAKTGNSGKAMARTGGGKEKQKNVKEKKQTSSKEEENYQNSVFEMQRKMKEQTIAHKLVLEALDNASDYIGPSYKQYYYY